MSVSNLIKAIFVMAMLMPAKASDDLRNINDMNIDPDVDPRSEVVIRIPVANPAEVDTVATPAEVTEEFDVINKRIELNPKNAANYFIRGEMRVATGDNKGAQSDFDHAAALDPKNPDTFEQRGEFRMYESKDYKGAVADFNRVYTLNPKYKDLFYNRGWAKKDAGDFDGAIADFDQVIAHNAKDVVRGYDARSGAKFAKHDFKGAIADLTKLIELDPRYAAGAYGLRGNAKQAIGDLSGAKSDFETSQRYSAH